jgi:hypothetical protein
LAAKVGVIPAAKFLRRSWGEREHAPKSMVTGGFVSPLPDKMFLFENRVKVMIFGFDLGCVDFVLFCVKVFRFLQVL